jgi:hypothetical protein
MSTPVTPYEQVAPSTATIAQSSCASAGALPGRATSATPAMPSAMPAALRAVMRSSPKTALQTMPKIGAVEFTIESSEAGACIAAYEKSAKGMAMLTVPTTR